MVCFSIPILINERGTFLEKIVIKSRKSGETVQEYPADEYVVARGVSKERRRRLEKLTNEQYEDLVRSVVGRTRGGKRIEGGRLVMTQHISCTEAAKMCGLTSASITQLVLQLEKAVEKNNRVLNEKRYGPAFDKANPAKVDPTLPAPTTFREVEEAPAKVRYMSYEQFKRILETIPLHEKRRGANEGARMALVQGEVMPDICRSIIDIDVPVTLKLIDKIKQIKEAEDLDAALAAEFE